MKAVLVFPPFPLQDRYNENASDTVGGHLNPLGVCYLAAVLEKAGVEVKIVDAAPRNLSEEAVVRETLAFGPDFVGVTALTPSFNRVEKICRLLKSKSPKTFLAVGGPHACLLPKETLKQTGADVVIVGEGETVIAGLAKTCKKNPRKGIVNAPLVKNLDELPFPARHLLDMSLYSALPNSYKVDKKIINISASRGCPFNCIFCCKAVVGRTYRLRSVENVVAEIKQVIKRYGTKEFDFCDDIFTLNRKWVLEFCKALEREKIKIVWVCVTRANCVDEEMLKAMKKAGCWNIFFGIEAGDQSLLDNIRKQETLEGMQRGVALTKRTGIEVRAGFMLGLPGETPELAEKTINFAIKIDPDYAQFTALTPFPGTDMYREAAKYGVMKKDINRFNMWDIVFVPYGYKDKEELLKVQKRAFRRFYFRPSYVIKRLLKMRSPKELKRNIVGLRMVLGFT